MSFGFPESSCFYTMGVTDRYLRVHRSNPIPGEDSDEIEDVEICFGIQAHLKEKIADVLRDDLLDANRLFL